MLGKCSKISGYKERLRMAPKVEARSEAKSATKSEAKNETGNKTRIARWPRMRGQAINQF
jgi:hypothetical protein